MKNLPTDVSNFALMISGNYIYIDKTRYIYDLFKGGTRYYFLSRPRRFGKSLLISTLKELFGSNRELFKDLWIDTSNYQWVKYPVIHLDFSVIDHKSAEELESSLRWTLEYIAHQHLIDITLAPTLGTKFRFLIEQLAAQYEHNQVVVLIDEYDKPILDNITNIQEAQAQQTILKSFYDVLKGVDAYLRAIFVTGVTKFTKTSIFSGLNNLNDITLAPEAASLLGYTKEEIEQYFLEYIARIAQTQQVSTQAIMQDMEQWYNGYRFSDELVKVYNPFSVLYYLKTKKRANYWFASGTPTFLISFLKSQYSFIEDIQSITLDIDSFGTFSIDDIPLVPLLFQTGYLTITDYDTQTELYTLGYPNTEVRESFIKYIIAAITDTHPARINSLLVRMTQALKVHNIDLFCELLQSLLTHIPYNLYIKQERYFHSLFQFLGILLSFEIQSEVVTDKGRIDLVITTQKYIYIFEFKFNTSPDVALRQIEENKYYERYLATKQHIVLIGLAFNYKQDKLTLEWHTKKIR